MPTIPPVIQRIGEQVQLSGLRNSYSLEEARKMTLDYMSSRIALSVIVTASSVLGGGSSGLGAAARGGVRFTAPS